MGAGVSVHVYLDRRDGYQKQQEYQVYSSSNEYDKCRNFELITYSITYNEKFKTNVYTLNIHKITSIQIVFTFHPKSVENNISEVQCLYSYIHPEIPLMVGLTQSNKKYGYYPYQNLEKLKKSSSNIPETDITKDNLKIALLDEFKKRLDYKLKFTNDGNKMDNIYRKIDGLKSEFTRIINRPINKNLTGLLSKGELFKGEVKDGRFLDQILQDMYNRTYNGIICFYMNVTQEKTKLILVDFFIDCDQRIQLVRKDSDGIYWKKDKIHYGKARLYEELQAIRLDIRYKMTMILDIKPKGNDTVIYYNGIEVTIMNSDLNNIVTYRHSPLSHIFRSGIPNILLNNEVFGTNEKKDPLKIKKIDSVFVYYVVKKSAENLYVDNKPLLVGVIEDKPTPKVPLKPTTEPKLDHIPHNKSVKYFVSGKNTNNYVELKSDKHTDEAVLHKDSQPVKVPPRVEDYDDGTLITSSPDKPGEVFIHGVTWADGDWGDDFSEPDEKVETKVSEPSEQELIDLAPDNNVFILYPSPDSDSSESPDQESESKEPFPREEHKGKPETELPVPTPPQTDGMSSITHIVEKTLKAVDKKLDDIQEQIQSPKLDLEELRSEISQSFQDAVASDSPKAEINEEKIINPTPSAQEPHWEAISDTRNDNNNSGDNFTTIIGGSVGGGAVCVGTISGGVILTKCPHLIFPSLKALT